MILNKRDQLLAWALGATLGAIVLYYLVDGLWLGQRDALDKEIKTLSAQVKKDTTTIKTAALDRTEFDKLRIQTLDAKVPDASVTDRLIQTTFNNAGLTITGWSGGGIRPSSSTGGKDFMEAKYTATATTTTARLARFLQTIETAPIPARIDGMTITTPKPGVDNLRVEFTVSALLYMPKTPAATVPATIASRPATASGPAATRTTTATSPAGAPAPAPADDLSALEERMRQAREKSLSSTTAPAATSTAPQKSAAEIEQEMIARRQQAEMATSTATKPAASTSTAPGGTQ